MSIREELINKRDELVTKNNEYNEQLTNLRNLREEVDGLKRTKSRRIDKVRSIYWIICTILILFQVVVDLDGLQNIISMLGIQVNAMFLFRGTGKIRREITDKEKELSNLELENSALYDLVFDLRCEVHRLADEVEKMPVLELEEKYQDVIEEVRDFSLPGEVKETPVMKMLSLY